MAARSKNLGLNPSARSPAVPIHTAGEVFTNGILELVRDRRGPTAFQLVLSKNVKHVIASSIARGGCTYFPAAVPAKLAKALSFPSRPTRCGSTRELFDDVSALLRRCTSGVMQNAIPLLTYSTFATWFPDCVPIAPCLVLTGDATQSLQVLRVLAALTYHGLLLGDVTPAGLRSLPINLRLTLLMDQRQLTGRLERLIALSNHPGYLVPGNGDVRELYCSKAIYVGERIPRALADGSLHIAVSPGDGCSMSMISELHVKAEDLQNKLLYYRMQNRPRALKAEFMSPELTRPLRVLASALAVPFPNDPELRDEIILALKAQDQQIRLARRLDRTCVVIEAVLFFCHEGKSDKIHVKEITEAANQILKGRGEWVELTTEQVGHLLKRCGLITCRLDGAGNGLVLDLATQGLVHMLARSYDVLTMQSGCRANCRVVRTVRK